MNAIKCSMQGRSTEVGLFCYFNLCYTFFWIFLGGYHEKNISIFERL